MGNRGQVRKSQKPAFVRKSQPAPRKLRFQDMCKKFNTEGQNRAESELFLKLHRDYTNGKVTDWAGLMLEWNREALEALESESFAGIYMKNEQHFKAYERALVKKMVQRDAQRLSVLQAQRFHPFFSNNPPSITIAPVNPQSQVGVTGIGKAGASLSNKAPAGVGVPMYRDHHAKKRSNKGLGRGAKDVCKSCAPCTDLAGGGPVPSAGHTCNWCKTCFRRGHGRIQKSLTHVCKPK